MDIQIVDPFGDKTFHEIIIESIDIGIIAADLEGKVLTINKAAERMWDFPKEMAIGNSFLLGLAADERARMQKTYNYIIRTGKTLRATGVVFRNRTCKKLYVNCYASFFGIPSGEKLGIAMWTEDITEEKMLENEVKMASVLHEIVIESIGTGIIAVDLDGNILTINQAAQEMYASPKETVIGKSFLMGLAEHERPRFQKTHDSVVRTGKVFRGSEIKLVNRTGKTLYINAYSSLIRSPSGEKLGVAMLTEDITERKMLQQEVQRADKLAALGQLSLGLSHEIRTPLGSIKALASLIKTDTALDEQKTQYLNVIVNEVNRLDRLSRELLDFAGSSKLKFRKVDINALIDKVMFLGKLNNSSKQLVIEQNLKENISPIYGDPKKLLHVFLNLLINSMDAIEEEGTIRIETSEENDWIIVRIADSGIGIPAQSLSKIFDPFYTTKENGTGLGLSIVHTIITDHCGHLYVESSQKAGTNFIIKLPVIKEGQNNEKTRHTSSRR